MAGKQSPTDRKAALVKEFGVNLTNWATFTGGEITGELPSRKKLLGDPEKSNAVYAREWSERLGGTVSRRQISKWRNGRISQPVPDTKMPTSSYRSNR